MIEESTSPVIKLFTVRAGTLRKKETEHPALVIRTTLDVPRQLWKLSGKFINLYSVHTGDEELLASIHNYDEYIGATGIKVEGFSEKEFEAYAKPLITKLYPEAVDAYRTERYAACLNRAAWVAWWKNEGALEADRSEMAVVIDMRK